MVGQAAIPRVWQRASLARVSADPRRRTFAAAVAIVLLLAIVHRATLGAPVFPVDDAYITMHNAQVLLWGHDPNFPGTSALTGATSLAHLALTALCSIPFGVRNGLYLAAWLSALLYATGLVRLAFAWGARPWQAGLLTALGLIVGRVPHQLMNGLETGLALGAVTWALAMASERGRQRALAAICGVLPFIRPELGVLSLALLAFAAWPLLRAGRRREIGVMALLAAATAAPWVLWSLIATGALLPSTAGAKVAFFAEGRLPGDVKRDWVTGFLRQFAGTLGIAVVAAVPLFLFRAGRAMLVLAVALVAFYYREFPGALGHYEQRYLYVLVPGIVLGAAWAVGRSRTFRWVALAVVIAGLLQSGAAFDKRWHDHLNGSAFTVNELATVAVWANQNIPPHSTVLIHDAGFISYATRFHLVDLVGLKTPRVIRFHEELTEPSGGARRHEAMNRIALQERPQYLIALNRWDAIYGIVGALRENGWRVDPLRAGEYTAYALTPPR